MLHSFSNISQKASYVKYISETRSSASCAFVLHFLQLDDFGLLHKKGANNGGLIGLKVLSMTAKLVVAFPFSFLIVKI